MQALLGEYWFDQPDEASKRVSNLLAGALPKGELDDGLRGKLARSARLMPEVAEVELRDDLFRRVQIHRNNADYGFLLSVCRLLSGRLFSEGRPGVVRFQQFDADDPETGNLFEAFVRGGYPLRVRSLDLGQAWPDLRDDLLNFADELADATGARVRSAA